MALVFGAEVAREELGPRPVGERGRRGPAAASGRARIDVHRLAPGSARVLQWDAHRAGRLRRTVTCGDRRTALLPGGNAQGPVRRRQARHTLKGGRRDGCGGWPGLAGRGDPGGAAAAEGAGGGKRTPPPPPRGGLPAVEGGGGVWAGVLL